MWSPPRQNKNWLKRDILKQTGMVKIRGKTNLVPTTKKNYAPLAASHKKFFFENGKQCVGNLREFKVSYKTNREALTVLCSVVKHLTL